MVKNIEYASLKNIAWKKDYIEKKLKQRSKKTTKQEQLSPTVESYAHHICLHTPVSVKVSTYDDDANGDSALSVDVSTWCDDATQNDDTCHVFYTQNADFL